MPRPSGRRVGTVLRLRVLADRLARAGYWTARLEYPGTGDSCDYAVERAGNHWTPGARSVEQAIDWLKEVSGARSVMLCGMRAGAMLATAAASSRPDVAGYLFFEPTVSGRSYVRELTLDAELHGGRVLTSGDIEVGEFRFGPATVSAIAATDLREAVPRAGQKVAVFARAESRRLDAFLAAWRQAGAEATTHGWSDDLNSLMGHPTFDAVRLPTFHDVIDWMNGAFPLTARPAAERALPRQPEAAVLRPQAASRRP